MIPHKTIWSLYDVLKFYSDLFMRSSSAISKLPRVVRDIEGWETVVELELVAFQKECRRIGFSQLEEQAQRIVDQAKLKYIPPELYDQRKKRVEILLEELFEAILSKLRSCLFIRVDTNRMALYSDDDLPRFGEKVSKAFPKSTYHISEASRCFALERWDACAYHLMAATEEALRKWARSNGFKTKGPIDLNDWKAILDAGKQKLDQLRNAAKSTSRDRAIQRLAEQLAHFGLIKDAYRNYIAHAREKYDERRAKNLMNQVEAFMQSLA